MNSFPTAGQLTLLAIFRLVTKSKELIELPLPKLLESYNQISEGMGLPKTDLLSLTETAQQLEQYSLVSVSFKRKTGFL